MKTTKRKKSQVQIGETVAVLAVFFIILIIAAVFYFNLGRGSIIKEQEGEVLSRSTSVVQRVLALPELQCSRNNIIESSCVDIAKLEKSATISSDPQFFKFYYDLFGFSKITVYVVYPKSQVGNYILYENKLPDYKNKIQTDIPVTINSPAENKNYFGYISVETYS